ncbi:hypothetical protein RJ640_004940 [Escallonia rubra]|uniref:Uncharacterized protein n=1 Tax=Escallonia rubra TaxID=112253 RepID=A0AA88RH98_9ASTE|nr:hypothetical protein RJ640_004940 [Escallonia rubra]
MFESRLISILRRNKSLNPILSSSPSHANQIGSCSSRVLKEASLRNPSRFFSSSSVAKLIRPSINGTSAGFYKPSFRNLSTTAASACKDNEGLKLLVTAGPHAQKMDGIWLFASAAWVLLHMKAFRKYSHACKHVIYYMELTSEFAQPRVSPCRLAAHLTSAFVIYCGLFWTALSVVMPEPPAESVTWVRGAVKVKRLVLPGHAFNTFPKMGDSWIPDDVFSMKPLMRNFFENTLTVQLDRRILATATLASIGGLWLATRKLDIHPVVRSLIGSTLGTKMESMLIPLNIVQIAGDFENINSSIICACFTRHCSPSRSFNSFNTRDPSQSYCATTFNITSQIFTSWNQPNCFAVS